MKRFYILILLISSSIALYSQSGDIKISGSIIDVESSDAIANVNITVVGERSGVISDKNGDFELMVGKLPVQLFFYPKDGQERRLKFLKFTNLKISIYIKISWEG